MSGMSSFIKEQIFSPGGNVTSGSEPLFSEMSSESIREKIAKIGQFPGLSEGLEKQILLLRCRDIETDEFLFRLEKVQRQAESLFESSLPESMEEETYLIAREYYDKAAEGLDYYLNGLQVAADWAVSGLDSLLEQARQYFAKGDKTTEEVILLAFETQENMREADEAIMRSLGIDPEGIV